MIRKLTYSIFIILISCGLKAQQRGEINNYRKFPITLGVQFQNFAMPFKDIGSNFRHLGFFVGTEISLNKNETLLQNAIMGSYFNKELGAGTYLSSQFIYQPHLFNRTFFRLQGGVGYLFVRHPVQAYKFENNAWKKTGGGKSQLIIPIELSVGYSFETLLGKHSPFFSYQLSPALFYNQTMVAESFASVQRYVTIVNISHLSACQEFVTTQLRANRTYYAYISNYLFCFSTHRGVYHR